MELSILRIVNKRISFYCQNTNLLPPKPKTSLRHLKLGIQKFHRKYTERKKKRRVNFILKFHSSLKKFVKYFTMITKRYMFGTKVQNFIGL